MQELGHDPVLASMRREIFEKHRGLIRSVFRKMAIDESEFPMVPIGTIGKPASNHQPISMPSYYYIFARRPNVLQRKWDFGKFSQKTSDGVAFPLVTGMRLGPLPVVGAWICPKLDHDRVLGDGGRPITTREISSHAQRQTRNPAETPETARSAWVARDRPDIEFFEKQRGLVCGLFRKKDSAHPGRGTPYRSTVFDQTALLLIIKILRIVCPGQLLLQRECKLLLRAVQFGGVLSFAILFDIKGLHVQDCLDLGP